MIFRLSLPGVVLCLHLCPLHIKSWYLQNFQAVFWKAHICRILSENSYKDLQGQYNTKQSKTKANILKG
jgi:hypothetical protein